MANEFNVNVNVVCNNSPFKQTFSPGAVNINQAAIGVHHAVVTVQSSAAETVATGDVGTLGLVCGRNLDDTNYVQIGAASTGSTMVTLQRVNAGEPFFYRADQGATLMAKANTAAVKLDLLIFEN